MNIEKPEEKMRRIREEMYKSTLISDVDKVVLEAGFSDGWFAALAELKRLQDELQSLTKR